MAKQSINVGATANDKKGDSLRAAFQKVNANFTELYTALGLAADADLNLGNFVFESNTVRLTNTNNDDSTATQIEIAQPVRIESNLTVGGDVVPNTANGGNLGSIDKPWRSLYVSNNTVFLGGVPLSLEAGTNELRINNVPVSQTITYADIPNAPTIPVDISDLTDDDGLLGGGGAANTGDWAFSGNAAYNGTSFDQGLYVAPGGEGVSYIFVPGNSQSANTALQLSNGSATGQVTVTAYNKNWQFDSDGDLTLPQGGDILDSNGDSVLGSADTASVRNAISIASTGTTFTPSSYGDVLALSVVKDGAGFKYISAQRSQWAVSADYDIFEVLPSGTVFTVVLAGGTYTFTTTSKNGGPGESSVSWYGEFSPAISGTVFEAPASITWGAIVTPLIYDNTTGELSFDTSLLVTETADVARNIESENDVSIRVNLTDSTQRVWQFGEDGSLTLPAGGDILDSTGVSVLGGGGTAVETTRFLYNGKRSGGIESDAGMSFKSDGTKFYLLGSDKTVYEYTLSTAWDVSTSGEATETDISSLGTLASNDIRNGLFFKPDGTEFYLIELVTVEGVNDVFHLGKVTLSTAWDLSSTLTYVRGAPFSYSYGSAFVFSSDGLNFYYGAAGKIGQWNLSTAWDISTISVLPDGERNFSNLDGYSPSDIAFSADGTVAYISTLVSVGFTSNARVIKYTLGTAWDITTATPTTDIIRADEFGAEYFGSGGSLTLKPDLSRMYLSAGPNNFQSPYRVYQLNATSVGEQIDGGYLFADGQTQTRAVHRGQLTYTWSQFFPSPPFIVAPTTVDFNVLYIDPSAGYSGTDPVTVTLPTAGAGTRLVILATYSDSLVTVNESFTLTAGIPAEFMYIVGEGWCPLYGATPVTP
jgi:hypothetical protein